MLIILLTAFVVSLIVTLLMVRNAKAGSRVHDHDLSGPQKFHTAPVARIGGIGIFVGTLAGVVAIAGVVVWLKPEPVAEPVATNVVAAGADSTRAAGQIGYKTLQAVLEQRCYLCHGAQVQMKNVRLDSPAGVKLHAQNIYQQSVVTKVMPLNNATGISEAERALIKQWFESGASVD